MARTACKLIYRSPGTRIQRGYASLSMLNRSGKLDLTQQPTAGQAIRVRAKQHL